MALTETHAEACVDTNPESAKTMHSLNSAHSLSSIKSLGDIPFVDSSFDLDFDTVLGNNNNISASYFSTPRFTRTNTGNSIPQSVDSPWSVKTATHIQPEANADRIPQDTLSENDNSHHLGREELEQEQVGFEPSHSRDNGPSVMEGEKSNFIDDVAKAGGAAASMNDYIGTWAPTAHYVVVAAAALQRDAAAFASTLSGLLNTTGMTDPNYFATQYYQLREAYSSLLSLGDFSTVTYGQQGWTRASKKSTGSSIPPPSDLETSWDDRQLVDSFVTLLRTAPGFIASALLQMSDSEAETFCAEGDGSALNVLFHGVLGSAQDNRPRLLADVLKHLRHDHAKHKLFTNALIGRLLGLSTGTLSISSSTKLQRFMLAVLDKTVEIPDFEPILAACVPAEFNVFVQHVSDECWEDIRDNCLDHLDQFARHLIVFPHQYGIMNETFITEKQREYLETLTTNLYPAMDRLLSSLRSRKESQLRATDPWWKPDEFIVLKGSDIIQMFHTLLPSRGVFGTSSHSSPTNSSDENEWCLDSIRADLVPVIHGLSHSASTRTDGWQIFKVGGDGLITDLNSDMGLKNTDDENEVTPEVFALCEAVAHHDAPTVMERVEAAREDASLRGDHYTLFSLQNAETQITKKHVDAMNRHVNLLKVKCRFLRDTLDQAAREQRRERERLSKLLAILDNARVHVWYESEVRTGSLYYRSREFLHVLYPNCSEDDDDKLSERSISGENMSSSVSARSRRLSILSSHNIPESPFYSRDIFTRAKLTDKEVDAVVMFMRRNRVRNVIPSEEKFHRALVEVGNLARKVLDRDHLASYVMFKRDRHYQTNYAQQHAQGPAKSYANRNSHHHRRSSLGLFDFFDSASYYNNQQKLPLTLHTTTSTQFLGLASSHESLRNATSHQSSSRHSDESPNSASGSMGPPRPPTIYEVQALMLSDIGHGIVANGSETDLFMRQTGRMLLEGDGQDYQPLLNDISLATSPYNKLDAVESLFIYTRCVIQRKLSSHHVSRADVVHELSKKFGRESGTLYRDLQIISTLVNPAKLDRSDAFEDCCAAAKTVLDTVVVRSMDYATRFMRYYMETTTSTAPKMAIMGINDSVAIWEFCAKQGNAIAQQKLADLYLKFPHLKLELRPLTRPSLAVDGVDNSGLREAVSLHWMALASRI